MTTSALASDLSLVLRDEGATADLAVLLSSCLRPGDEVLLSGDLGSGKTTFARALIRALCAEAALDVPSPTYSLVQLYDGLACEVIHLDLYRIRKVEEIAHLGLQEAAQDAIVIVEWPEHGYVAKSVRQFHLSLVYGVHHTGAVRKANIAVTASLKGDFYRALAIQAFLEKSGWETAKRMHLQGDASTKTFLRLVRAGMGSDGLAQSAGNAAAQAILCMMPQASANGASERTQAYAKAAHLATSVRPVLFITKILRTAGLSAPAIYAHDEEAGFILQEDFGTDMIAQNGMPVPERYEVAVSILAHLHGYDWPSAVQDDAFGSLTIADYDGEAYIVELEQFLDWYVPHQTRKMLSARAREDFLANWLMVLDAHILAHPRVWTLRDYHSPNLFWLAHREGLAKIGIIDIQDTVMGHPAYDVASLCQDARASVGEALELELLGAYVRARHGRNPHFDMADFAKAYKILGAQRCLKILGVFTRLERRDGKAQYLAHLPRVKQYLLRNLSHPALAPVASWFASFPDLLEA